MDKKHGQIAVAGDNTLLIFDGEIDAIIPLYCVLEDGTVNLLCPFTVLWKIFRYYNDRFFPAITFNDDCYFPPEAIFTASRSQDVFSKNFFVFAKINGPVSEDSTVTNEGIPLALYFNTHLACRLNFRLKLTITKSGTLYIYRLQPGRSDLRLFVDSEGNITRYCVEAGCFEVVIPYSWLLYFYSEDVEISSLEVTAQQPPLEIVVTAPPLVNLCIEHKGKKYCSPLYNNVIDNEKAFTKVPTPQWKPVADVINNTFIALERPVPLVPIKLQNSEVILQVRTNEGLIPFFASTDTCIGTTTQSTQLASLLQDILGNEVIPTIQIDDMGLIPVPNSVTDRSARGCMGRAYMLVTTDGKPIKSRQVSSANIQVVWDFSASGSDNMFIMSLLYYAEGVFNFYEDATQNLQGPMGVTNFSIDKNPSDFYILVSTLNGAELEGFWTSTTRYSV